jgi:hypothetical protein
MKKNAKPILVLLLVFCVVVVYLGVPWGLRSLGLISPGWEIYDQIGALEYRDTIYDETWQFTTPRELKGVYWKVDLDQEYYGVPTMMVEVGDIHHVDFTGKDIPSDEYAKTITVTRGNDSYYLDYHIYLYTVTIRTIADYRHYWTDGNIPMFEHETSWPYEGRGTLGNKVGNGHVGREFSGGVYTKFVISPWRGGTYRTAPENYTLYNCWAGVMNTYVLKKEQGQIANQWGELPDPDPAAPMFVKGGLDEGNQVPMLEDDGTFGTSAPTVNWDPSLSPDVRINSTIVHYLPVEMEPGLKLHLLWHGGCDAIYPCDVYVQYTLRVDVLQVHDFVLETAYKPPTPKTPQDFFSWVASFWEGIFNGLDAWLNNPFNMLLMGIFGIIIVIVLIAIFAPGTFVVASSLARKRGNGG